MGADSPIEYCHLFGKRKAAAHVGQRDRWDAARRQERNGQQEFVSHGPTVKLTPLGDADDPNTPVCSPDGQRIAYFGAGCPSWTMWPTHRQSKPTTMDIV